MVELFANQLQRLLCPNPNVGKMMICRNISAANPPGLPSRCHLSLLPTRLLPNLRLYRKHRQRRNRSRLPNQNPL